VHRYPAVQPSCGDRAGCVYRGVPGRVEYTRVGIPGYIAGGTIPTMGYPRVYYTHPGIPTGVHLPPVLYPECTSPTCAILQGVLCPPGIPRVYYAHQGIPRVYISHLGVPQGVHLPPGCTSVCTMPPCYPVCTMPPCYPVYYRLPVVGGVLPSARCRWCTSVCPLWVHLWENGARYGSIFGRMVPVCVSLSHRLCPGMCPLLTVRVPECGPS